MKWSYWPLESHVDHHISGLKFAIGRMGPAMIVFTQDEVTVKNTVDALNKVEANDCF